jgi:GNAT superfamily N-acetyltransferase
MIVIRRAGEGDIPALHELYDSIGKKEEGYFEEAFGRSDIYMAYANKSLAGFCLLNFAPRYRIYRRLNIPEIQDINVLPAERRKGIAIALINYCEEIAREQGHDMIGISVGLSREYGPAQILYAKLGYVPDGNGVTYDREPIAPERAYRIDDDLSLMLIKPI